jgi:hypothetical protein
MLWYDFFLKWLSGIIVRRVLIFFAFSTLDMAIQRIIKGKVPLSKSDLEVAERALISLFLWETMLGLSDDCALFC